MRQALATIMSWGRFSGLFVSGGLAALAIAWFFTARSPVSLPTPNAENKAEILYPSDEAGAVLGPVLSPVLSIDIARIGPDGSAVFAGKAAGQIDVHLFDNAQPLISTRSNQNGEWVATPDQPLTPGKHFIIAEMILPDGQVVQATKAVVIELSADGKSTPLVAIVPMTQSDRELAKILSVPEAIAPRFTTSDQPEIFIRALNWLGADQLQISGYAQKGRAVRGRFAGQNFSAVPLKNQKWTVRIALPAAALSARTAQIEAELLDDANTHLAQTSLTVRLSDLREGRDGSDMLVIRKGDILWRIAYRTYGSGFRYVDIVKRNQIRIDNPDLIFPEQIFTIPETK